MYGGCWNPPAKEKPLSPSDEKACSALHYADGSLVTAGDVVKINNAICTVLRMVPNQDGSPGMVACRIEGCGEIEHGVFADTFRKHHPQNARAMTPATESDHGK